jgi:CubicO group peptidase (beta-lactamase class C family)
VGAPVSGPPDIRRVTGRWTSCFGSIHASRSSPAQDAYSNIGYWLLGQIVERASGERFTSYVTAHIIQPLDLSPAELAYTVADPAHASGYLEKYSFITSSTFVIDRAPIGGYEGTWLRIRDLIRTTRRSAD